MVPHVTFLVSECGVVCSTESKGVWHNRFFSGFNIKLGGAGCISQSITGTRYTGRSSALRVYVYTSVARALVAAQ
jgi:hypothetical protein